MVGELRVSAVVCAYTEDRWTDVVASVASLEAGTRQPDEVVLVIDHNPALAHRATEQWGGSGLVRVLPNEHAQGLSGARNTGLQHVTGDVVAFLDDDAAARPDWLERLVVPFADPAVVAVGGGASPRWPAEAPACLPRELLWIVGCSFTPDLPDDGSGPVTEVRNVMGCSMALRREPVLAVGGFAESMGRRGTLPLGCEETDLCIRLRQADPGARVLLVPDAVVDHRVSVNRTRWSYLVRRCRSEGRSKAVLSRRVGSEDGLSAERSYVASAIPRAVVRELASAVRGGARRRALGAAVALVLAVLVTAAGYLVGLARTLAAASWTADVGVRRATALVLLLAGVAACLAALVGAQGGGRLAVTALFLVLGPGWAVAGFLRRPSVSLAWTVALGVGMAVGVLGGESMLLFGDVHPVGALYLVALVCAPLLLRHTIAVR
ncbi:glycosyltransferase family 2 protein [Actinomycetospora chiangmaiensis]|uniref:glycosyltransferase family 2 protein n=1 Tax=Actinomycetospora chiangmaiensis TaxID=402650 RepID=UPI00037CDB51|nr:glycosyltransferase [Actinomycetospora chiangmaiensis]